MPPRPNHSHLLTACLWLALFASSPACAQQGVPPSDPLAESLGLTRATGSLPLWQKPDAQSLADLSEQVRSTSPSVFIIGSPNNQYGTGFVISKEHRLLATNAHVADLLHDVDELLAIGNETTDVFKVEKVWYHPGVIRETKAGINVRSQNPGDGEVFPMGPDVAVIQLAGDETLPEALPLATPEELGDLFGKPVGMIGFPGHDTIHWPQLGEKAAASYHQGVVARLTDFVNSTDADPRDKQFLRHTMGSYGGFSGSPIFLANGHVAAIHNAAGSQKSGPVIALLAYGIRIDCLWELLAYHSLTDMINVPIPSEEMRLARFAEDDARVEDFRKVRDMVRRSRILMSDNRHAEAGELLNEAIRRMPTYADAYSYQSMNFQSYLAHVWDNTPRLAKERGQLPQFIEIRKFAVESKQKAVELEPTNTTYLSGLAINKQNLAFALNFAANQPPADQTESRALAEKLLAIDHLTPLARFNAYTIHANSHVKVADSLPWYTKAIEAEPYDDVGYLNRARNLEIIGEHERAADDRARADKLRRAFVSSLSAWMLATASDDSARDGKEALRLATLACELTEYEYYAYLRSLAAAHAELGNFAEATSWAAKALELGPPHEKSDIARQLRSYRNNQPWRE